MHPSSLTLTDPLDPRNLPSQAGVTLTSRSCPGNKMRGTICWKLSQGSIPEDGGFQDPLVFASLGGDTYRHKSSVGQARPESTGSRLLARCLLGAGKARAHGLAAPCQVSAGSWEVFCGNTFIKYFVGVLGVLEVYAKTFKLQSYPFWGTFYF